MRWLIYGMVYLGAALMVWNIICFVRFLRFVQQIRTWNHENRILYLPVMLLVLFLLGYLFIGFFGKPDIIVAAVLFSGSVFVYVMYMILNDITRQIVQSERMEAELIASERSNRAKTAFLATISHEMRTPLNVILGLDGIALMDPDVPPKTRCQLEQIGQSGRHLLGLIDNILDMNRVETGTLTIDCRPFSLGDSLSQIDAIVQGLCEEKGLTYETEVGEGVVRWYSGDQTQLQRALLCMLDNAVKFTDAPGTVRFSVNRTAEGPLEFVIADTGEGMDETYLSSIFDLFSQEDDSFTNPHGGSGLGLPVARSILSRMGGSIDVKSEKGVGSTFTVRVPLDEAEAPEGALFDAEEELPSLDGRRILIVEDLAENAEIAADLLELEGAVSEHALNGRIAVEMVQSAPEGYYDAILMDLRMPEMDGLTATRTIRSLERADAAQIPIIALTANASDIDIQHSLEAGMDAHLAKPTDAELMYKTIRQALARTSILKRGDRT